jgi:hypothetical protein
MLGVCRCLLQCRMKAFGIIAEFVAVWYPQALPGSPPVVHLEGAALPPEQQALGQLREAAANLDEGLGAALLFLLQRRPAPAYIATDMLAAELGWNWTDAAVTALGHGAAPFQCWDQAALLLLMMRNDAELPYGELHCRSYPRRCTVARLCVPGCARSPAALGSKPPLAAAAAAAAQLSCNPAPSWHLATLLQPCITAH